MNVIITLNGQTFAVDIKEAQRLCKEIHEQLYPTTKEK